MIEADEMGERVPEKMSQRTQVVLHIGMNKTGTSSIQSSLHRNAARLWTQHRILYPLAGRVTRERRYHDHRLLAWSSIRRYSHHFGVPISDIYWAELAAEIEARQPRLCVISSEYFWPAQAGHDFAV
ncbi:MAG: hypothetical protein M1457_04735, partial [bacterium]|nr:hypothetical protein [bacterium]